MNPVPGYRNVAFVGEVGVGKSSLVNMLVGQDVAKVALQAGATTTEPHGYAVELRDLRLNAYDTTGLNAPNNGTASLGRNLRKLVHELTYLGGLDLLVFVIRIAITKTTVDNYHLLGAVFCRDQVPIVVVVTGLELELDQASWWKRNAEVLETNDIKFDGHGIVTGTAGTPEISFEKQYMTSKQILRDLIYAQCNRPGGSRTLDRLDWCSGAEIALFNKFKNGPGITITTFVTEAKQGLMEKGVKEEEASKVAVDVSNALNIGGSRRTHLATLWTQAVAHFTKVWSQTRGRSVVDYRSPRETLSKRSQST